MKCAAKATRSQGKRVTSGHGGNRCSCLWVLKSGFGHDRATTSSSARPSGAGWRCACVCKIGGALPGNGAGISHRAPARSRSGRRRVPGGIRPPSLHQLSEDAAYPGWFRRVVRKHADRHRNRLLAVELGELPGTNDPLVALKETEQRRSVQNDVAAPPPRLRSSIALFYGSGQRGSRIASTSLNTRNS